MAGVAVAGVTGAVPPAGPGRRVTRSLSYRVTGATRSTRSPEPEPGARVAVVVAGGTVAGVTGAEDDPPGTRVTGTESDEPGPG